MPQLQEIRFSLTSRNKSTAMVRQMQLIASCKAIDDACAPVYYLSPNGCIIKVGFGKDIYTLTVGNKPEEQFIYNEQLEERMGEHLIQDGITPHLMSSEYKLIAEECFLKELAHREGLATHPLESNDEFKARAKSLRDCHRAQIKKNKYRLMLTSLILALLTTLGLMEAHELQAYVGFTFNFATAKLIFAAFSFVGLFGAFGWAARVIRDLREATDKLKDHPRGFETYLNSIRTPAVTLETHSDDDSFTESAPSETQNSPAYTAEEENSAIEEDFSAIELDNDVE